MTIGKPSGIALRMNERGDPVMSVTRSTRSTDMIWDAVREAIAEGMRPRAFLIEVEEAWRDALKEEAEDAMKEFGR